MACERNIKCLYQKLVTSCTIVLSDSMNNLEAVWNRVRTNNSDCE